MLTDFDIFLCIVFGIIILMFGALGGSIYERNQFEYEAVVEGYGKFDYAWNKRGEYIRFYWKDRNDICTNNFID